MKLDTIFYQNLRLIKWFENCGTTKNLFSNVPRVELREQALSLLMAPLWADIRTEAQGDLTGYLAKHCYASYGGYWNKLSKESRAMIETAFLADLQSAMNSAGLPDISNNVILDINRAALEHCYAMRFNNIPRFFSRLLDVYSSGHLPCGWTENIQAWPQGEVIVF